MTNERLAKDYGFVHVHSGIVYINHGSYFNDEPTEYDKQLNFIGKDGLIFFAKNNLTREESNLLLKNSDWCGKPLRIVESKLVNLLTELLKLNLEDK